MVEIFLVIWKKGDDGDWYLRRDILELGRLGVISDQNLGLQRLE